MKRTILKKNVAVAKYMSNKKRERDTREDNSNNINIKVPTCLCVFALCLCFYCFTVVLKHYLPVRWMIYSLLKKKKKKTRTNIQKETHIKIGSRKTNKGGGGLLKLIITHAAIISILSSEYCNLQVIVQLPFLDSILIDN